MKTHIYISGFLIVFAAPSVFANEPADKVEPIKRAEFLRQQYSLFTKADKNYDAQLTHDEILHLRHEQNRPKYIAAFKALDTNNNGYLSHDEIESRHEDITANAIKRVSKLKENLLSKYDLDGNGTITNRELDTYVEIQSQKLRNKTAKNAARDLKGKDSDESGSVSLDEYVESKTVSARLLIKRPAGKTYFLTRDPNGDKIITRSENEKFANELFDALDKNKNDKLSVSEQKDKIFKSGKNLSTRGVYIKPKHGLNGSVK
jgi:Ca2+-binding EF-hand superfamily protein